MAPNRFEMAPNRFEMAPNRFEMAPNRFAMAPNRRVIDSNRSHPNFESIYLICPQIRCYAPDCENSDDSDLSQKHPGNAE
jgi:hypothetical protein